jgi:hypothetical protein
MTTRGLNGHFNGTPGPGRPRRETERAYLDATVSSCSLADWRVIVKKAVADAKKGNAVARRWLSDVLIGRDPIALRDVIDEVRELMEVLERGR